MAEGNPKIVATVSADTKQYEVGMHKVRQHTDRTSSAIKNANGHLRMMRGGFGQVGHQVQDIAVQLQMGQNALLVFGQQGSQIASLFGPRGALLGALFAVGAALGMSLAPALFGATEAAKNLEDRMKSLRDEFDKLTVAQKAFVRTQVAKTISDNNKLIREAQRELNDLRSITLSFNQIFFGPDADEKKDRIEELRATLDTLKQENARLEKSIDDTTNAFEKQEQKLNDQIKTFDKSAQAVRDYGLQQMLINNEITKSEFESLLKLSHILGEKERLKEQEVEAEKAKQKALRKAEKEEEAAQRQLARMRDRFSGQMADGFVDAITGAKSFSDAMKSVAKSVVDSLLKMIIQKLITDQIFNAMMPFFSSLPGGSGVSTPVPKLEGGGFTGYGPRSGGIDGRGGFPAILHPNETVVDHTRGQGSGVVINQSINISTGVQQTVRAEVANLMPQIANATKAAVADARTRGGNFSKALVGA